jgi:alcohol dehydrogenase
MSQITEAQLRRDHRPNAAAPIVAYGDDAVLRIPAHAAALGATRVLLVCGRRSFEASGAARMLPELQQVADVRRWSDFRANTDAADLRVGLEVMRDYHPDLVLGVGGGSAMDMAKLLAAFRDMPDDKVLTAIESGERTETRRQRLFLVPTTSGSGAEATHFAVVYIGDNKYSIGGPAMRPDVIVLDPILSVSGSAYQRATSGIDAVCQAIESLWATAATDRSRYFARIALRLLLPAIERYVKDPDATSARAMCIGSHFAGRAIDLSRTTAAHALSYGITKGYGVSHGHAVALTLSAFLEAHANAPLSRLNPAIQPDDHSRAINEILTALGAADGRAAREQFADLLTRLGLTSDLREVVRSDDQVTQLVRTVNIERLNNNPIRFSQPQLIGLLGAMSDSSTR